MGEELIFNNINKLLEGSEYGCKIRNIADLKAFLNNKNNERIKVYEEIEDMYYALVVGPGMW